MYGCTILYIINILKDDLHYVQVLASLMRAAPDSFAVELQIGLRSQLNYLPPLNPRFL